MPGSASRVSPEPRLPWVVRFSCAAHARFPFIAFMNTEGVNRCSAGLSNLTDDTEVLAEVNQEKCAYDLSMTTAVSPETEPYFFSLDLTPELWVERLAAWRESLNLEAGVYPGAVWEPVFCTWYAVHGAVTQEWVEKNASIAAHLGCKTLIIDDGWSYDEKKRISPESIADWYCKVADWRISREKFPDFDSHVKRVRQWGMKYLLWVAPHLIGLKSRFLAEHPDCMTDDPVCEGHVHLNPASPAAEDLLQSLAALLAEHRIVRKNPAKMSRVILSPCFPEFPCSPWN